MENGSRETAQLGYVAVGYLIDFRNQLSLSILI